jgi:uncharacterized protein (TIGR02145 family)
MEDTILVPVDIIVSDSTNSISPNVPDTGLLGQVADKIQSDSGLLALLAASLIAVLFLTFIIVRKSRTRKRITIPALMLGLTTSLSSIIVNLQDGARADDPQHISIGLGNNGKERYTFNIDKSKSLSETDKEQLSALADNDYEYNLSALLTEISNTDLSIDVSGTTLSSASQTLKNISTPDYSTGEIFDLDITASIPQNLPIGKYSSVIEFKVAASKIPVTTLQKFTANDCNALNVYHRNSYYHPTTNDEDLITLTDTRDNQQYLVGKLDDGNCWILNNLKLGSTEKTMTLTKNDTNTENSYILPQVKYWQDSDLTVASVAYTDESATTDIWSSNFYGYYYNFCTVSLGAYCTGSSSAVVAAISQDICPCNWRIPKNDELHIWPYYSDYWWWRNMRLVPSGRYYGDLSNNIGDSDTYIFTAEGKNLYLYPGHPSNDDEGFVESGTGGGRLENQNQPVGMSVRCLLKYDT